MQLILFSGNSFTEHIFLNLKFLFKKPLFNTVFTLLNIVPSIFPIFYKAFHKKLHFKSKIHY